MMLITELRHSDIRRRGNKGRSRANYVAFKVTQNHGHRVAVKQAQCFVISCMQLGIKLPHSGLEAGICGVVNLCFTNWARLQMMQQNSQLHVWSVRQGPTNTLMETVTSAAPHHSSGYSGLYNIQTTINNSLYNTAAAATGALLTDHNRTKPSQATNPNHLLKLEQCFLTFCTPPDIS